MVKAVVVLCAVLALLASFALAARDGDASSPSNRIRSFPKGHSFALLPHLKHYELIEPELHHQISTMSKEKDTVHHNGVAYPRTTAYKFRAFDKDFHLDMQKNLGMFGPNYRQIRAYYEDGRLVYNTEAPFVNCYYKGHVNGDKKNFLAVSTCDSMLRGLVMHEGDMYYIEPAVAHIKSASANQHIFYRAKDVQRTDGHTMGCSVEGSTVDVHADLTQRLFESTSVPGSAQVAHDHSHEHEHDHGHSHDGLPSGSLHAQILERISETNRKVRTQAASKYVELFVANDNKRSQAFGGAPESDSNDIVNVVNTLYDNAAFSPTVNVVLVSQLTFVLQDPFTVADDSNGQVDVNQLLSAWHTWRSNPANTPAHDCGHLLSGRSFVSPTIGYAGVGVMCNPGSSGGIDQMTFTLNFNAATLAHEMGHNFGMQHDTTSCGSSYIMSSSGNPSTPANQFSSCSKSSLSNYMSTVAPTCLDNVPTTRWGVPVCGNGYIEAGEQCDCLNNNCAGKDPCCNGTSCQLLPGARCSNQQQCCSNCSIIPASDKKVCRAAVSDCDLAEYCIGTASCPKDLVKGSGATCSDGYNGNGACYAGRCHSLERQCRVTTTSYGINPTLGRCGFQSTFNLGNTCGTLYCSSSTSSTDCKSLVSSKSGDSKGLGVEDGVPCDDGKQCKSGSCVASDQLNLYKWYATEWTPCFSCDEIQNRTIQCMNTDQSIVDDAACSGKPPTQRKCVNETIGCGVDETFSFLGINFPKWAVPLILGGVAVILVFCLYLGCRKQQNGEAPKTNIMRTKTLTQRGKKGREMKQLNKSPSSGPPGVPGRVANPVAMTGANAAQLGGPPSSSAPVYVQIQVDDVGARYIVDPLTGKKYMLN